MYVDDETRLLVMRDEARAALEFVGPRTRDEFAADLMRQEAVAWCLKVIGQTASKLTAEARLALGEALTTRVVSVYERLVEGDYETDPADLWTTVTEDLPRLCATLERVLADPTVVRRPGVRGPTRTMSPRIAIDRAQIAAFCERHSIRRLALFGSVLREDFGPESDVDVLVEYEPGLRLSLLDLAAHQQELSELIGRQVDLREPEELSRYIRQRVLDGAEVLYVRG
jgi:predicted nucleotidyltransferase/uncharacterized protein with HEPN domain